MKPYPRWRWCKRNKCVVEIISIGHFPSTVLAKLPDDRVVEIDMTDLEDTNGRDTGSQG